MGHCLHRFAHSTTLPFLLLSVYKQSDCIPTESNCTIHIYSDSRQSFVNCNYNQDVRLIKKELVVYHYVPNYADNSHTKDAVFECRWNGSYYPHVCSSEDMQRKVQLLSNSSFKFPLSDTRDLGEYMCQTRPFSIDDKSEPCSIINQTNPLSDPPTLNSGADDAEHVGVGVGVAAILAILVILSIIVIIWRKKRKRKKVPTGTPCTEDTEADPPAHVNSVESPLLPPAPIEVTSAPESCDQSTRQCPVPIKDEINDGERVNSHGINQSLGGDTTDSSCKATSEKWTEDKERTLSESSNLTESSSEQEVERCMLECRKLERECTLYLDQSKAFGATANLSKEVSSSMEKVAERAATEQKRLASLQRTLLRRKFMSKMKVIKQQNNRPQEIETFVQKVKQRCKRFWDEDASEERQLDLSVQNLKKLLKLEIGCTHYIQVSKKTIPALGNQNEYAKWTDELANLLLQIQVLQVNFEDSLSEAIFRLVLQEITQGKSNKEVTIEQHSNDIHNLAQRMSLVITDPEIDRSPQVDTSPPENTRNALSV